MKKLQKRYDTLGEVIGRVLSTVPVRFIIFAADAVSLQHQIRYGT